ncbi:hypothetical protein K466DRAFT_658932 [Polyporus arcularius HHB13444]|uniref:Protein kinase domain-containing protein n=1 Tax=Polyporus arcularius HHB13444 TaxID=1314778 RepID=A0A5C3PVW1_9APHY|nr:hypothetical protein K466DRAFT_658932 [Polyporus arcularius HHB13444]
MNGVTWPRTVSGVALTSTTSKFEPVLLTPQLGLNSIGWRRLLLIALDTLVLGSIARSLSLLQLPEIKGIDAMADTERFLTCPHDREMAVPWPFLAGPRDTIGTAVENVGISGWPGEVVNVSQSTSTKALSQAELHLLAGPVRIKKQAVRPILDERAASILELWLETVPERHFYLANSISWVVQGEAGAEKWLDHVFSVLQHYYRQRTDLPGSLVVETQNSVIGYGLTITDIALCAPARRTPSDAKTMRSVVHKVVTAEIKSDAALLPHLGEIETCISRGKFKFLSTQAMLNDGERMLTQVYNQMDKNKVEFGSLASPNIFYLFQLCIAGGKRELSVEGPYFRKGNTLSMHDASAQPQSAETYTHLLKFYMTAIAKHLSDLGCSVSPVSDGHPGQRMQIVLDRLRSSRNDTDVRAVRRPASFARMRRRWAMFKLARSSEIVIHRADGSQLEPDFLFICIQWILTAIISDVINLHVSTCAGEGLTSVAYRGVYCGLPVIIKVPNSKHQDARLKEWNRLTLALPRDPDVASRLPVPNYYGLFKVDGQDIMVTSDNGLSLAQLQKEDMWSLVKNTVDCLRAVGIKPTDVSPRNIVYDGSRLTIIDFVDDEVVDHDPQWQWADC